MKKIIYYNWTKGYLADEFGDPISGVPAIAFGEKPQWELAILEEEGGVVRESDLTGIAYFRAALDVDFTSSTEVMCRTLPENITSSGNRISLTLDASTATFLAAVDGKQSTPAFFEITGMDSSSAPVFYVLFPVQACMMLDPLMPESLPPDMGENFWAEKGYVDAAIARLDANGDGIVEKALSAVTAERAESVEWENIQNKVLPAYTAGSNLHLSDDLVFSLDVQGASQGQILTIDGEGNAVWTTPEALPEGEVKEIVSSCISSAVFLPGQIEGSVASADYAASAGSIPWGGITEKPSAFPPDEALLTSLITAGGSAGQVLIHTGSSYTWQDADLSSGGTTGEGGGIATSKALITELNAGGCMVVPGAPAYIETNSGNLYPVSGGFVSSSSEGYLIDPTPYLLADGQASFTGTWTVYLLQIKEAENG